MEARQQEDVAMLLQQEHCALRELFLNEATVVGIEEARPGFEGWELATLLGSRASCCRLRALKLGHCGLRGSLPDALGSLRLLLMLHLHLNQLTGPITPSLGDCTHLEELFLQGNQL